MLYLLPFMGEDGKPYLLDGFKDVKDHGHFDVWGATSTLYSVIREGHTKTGPVVATGVLHIHLGDFMHQMTTFKVPGAQSEAAAARRARPLRQIVHGHALGRVRPAEARMTAGANPRRARGRAEPEYDAVVIGSGFGGSINALRLAQAGKRVAVLERGRRWRAGEFPRDTTRRERRLLALAAAQPPRAAPLRAPLLLRVSARSSRAASAAGRSSTRTSTFARTRASSTTRAGPARSRAPRSTPTSTASPRSSGSRPVRPPRDRFRSRDALHAAAAAVGRAVFDPDLGGELGQVPRALLAVRVRLPVRRQEYRRSHLPRRGREARRRSLPRARGHVGRAARDRISRPLPGRGDRRRRQRRRVARRRRGGDDRHERSSSFVVATSLARSRS